MKRAGILGGLVLLLGLDGALWSQGFARGDILTARLQFYPERMIGEKVTLSLVKVGSIASDHYDVLQGRYSYRINGSAEGLSTGDEIYVRGTFLEQGVLEQEWYERAPQRGNKKLLGFLGLAVTGLVLVAGTRITSDGLVLRG